MWCIGGRLRKAAKLCRTLHQLNEVRFDGEVQYRRKIHLTWPCDHAISTPFPTSNLFTAPSMSYTLSHSSLLFETTTSDRCVEGRVRSTGKLNFSLQRRHGMARHLPIA